MRLRPTARLLVLDDRDRVLLFKYEDEVPLDPAHPDLRVYWTTPGGGVEEGESFEDAALRELREETGLVADEVGPCLWTRKRLLRFPDREILFDERCFLVRPQSAEVDLSGLLPYELEIYRGHRWWSLEDLRDSSDIILPIALADVLDKVVSGWLPEEPIRVE